MQDARLECAACGEALAVKEDTDRCQCPLCDVPQVVDRTSTPPSVRVADARLASAALKRAQDDLKAISAEVRFFEGEAKTCRLRIALAALGIALAVAFGGAIFEAARPSPAEGGGSSRGSFLMPQMSKEEQNRVAQQAIGGIVVLIAVLTSVFLPWRRWREPGKILPRARRNRAHLEDLVRRLTERAQPPSR